MNLLQPNNLYLGDCLDLMKDIPDGSIDMVLCDLPYGTTACKWDTVIPFEPLWSAYRRVCKPAAALVFTANQPFTSKLVMSNVQELKYCLVWEKTRNSHPFFAKIRPLPQHEDILVFGAAKTYNPQMIKADKPFKRNTKTSGRLDGDKPGKRWDGTSTEATERYPHSVITISNPSLECGSHPTQKPLALMEYLIKTYTNPGDLVLDNCAGSGTTCLAARNLGRRFIGIEKDEGYYQIARKRLGLDIP